MSVVVWVVDLVDRKVSSLVAYLVGMMVVVKDASLVVVSVV